jgi:cyclase
LIRALVVLLVLGVAWGASAQQDIGATSIKTSTLQHHLYLLQGYGGNVLLSVGADGALLVDDEYAELTGKLVAAIAAVTDQPVRFVINTHWHDDHTGGNAYFGRAGAVIIAQENSARRMKSDQVMSLYGPQAAYPPIGQARVSYGDSMHLSFNGDAIDLLYPGTAHTDGDTLIFFHERNVLLTGDLFVGFDFRPPYFDDLNGGSLAGMIRGLDRVLSLIDAHTQVIPGHGDPAARKDVLEYRDRLVSVRDRIRQAIAHGASEDEVVAEHPLEGFTKPGRGADRWVRIVYREYR